MCLALVVCLLIGISVSQADMERSGIKEREQQHNVDKSPTAIMSKGAEKAEIPGSTLKRILMWLGPALNQSHLAILIKMLAKNTTNIPLRKVHLNTRTAGIQTVKENMEPADEYTGIQSRQKQVYLNEADSKTNNQKQGRGGRRNEIQIPGLQQRSRMSIHEEDEVKEEETKDEEDRTELPHRKRRTVLGGMNGFVDMKKFATDNKQLNSKIGRSRETRQEVMGS